MTFGYVAPLKGVTIIGSRETPPEACAALSTIACAVANAGFEVRSGHAQGADEAAEQGASMAPRTSAPPAAIFLPWSGFEAQRPVRGREIVVKASHLGDQLVRDHHPGADRLSPAAFSLHRRNGYQVLGEGLNNPSVAVVCWAATSGGTDQALRIAQAYKIPIYNLATMVLRGLPEAERKRSITLQLPLNYDDVVAEVLARIIPSDETPPLPQLSLF